MALIIDGELVEDEAIRQESQLLRPHMQEMMPDMDPIEMEMQLRDWSRENVIERVLLKRAAQAVPEPIPAEAIENALRKMREETGGGVCVTPSNEDAIRKEIEIRLRVDRLVEKVTGKVPPPKYREVVEYYRTCPERFETPELVHAAHIVKNVDEHTDDATALAAIRKIQEELNNGAGFEETADRYSDCAGNGGDLGHFSRGEMVPEFEEVVFSLKPGEISPIFRTPFGYHIARVLDRKPASVKKLEDARGEIENELRGQRQQRALEEFLDRLKARAHVEEVRSKSVNRP